MNNSRKISGLLFLFCFLMSIVLALFLSFASDTASEKKIEGKPLPMEHSTLLSIYDCDGYSVVDVKNPWGEGLLRRYVLVPKESQLPEGLPDGVLLRTPLDRVVVFSGVHVALLEELGVGESVAGVCDAQYI